MGLEKVKFVNFKDFEASKLYAELSGPEPRDFRETSAFIAILAKETICGA